jgi:hypothetical protein
MINPNQLGRRMFPASASQWMLVGLRGGAVTPPGLADGDPVTTWRDSSVNGNHATMTGTNRPTFKTAIVNGKPVVRFTSAGLSKLNLATPITGSFPWIVFAVTKPATNTSRIDSLDGNDGGSPRGPLVVSGGGCYIFTREGYYNITTPTTFAWHIFEGIYTGAGAGQQFIVIDGTNAGIFALTAAVNTGNFATIGYDTTPTYCDGDIAEIIIYTSPAMSGPDRLNVEKYLADKYAITVPAGGTAVQPDTVAGLMGWWKADSLL